MVQENHNEFDDSLLDRALEAAFDSGNGERTGATAVSVLDRIEKRHGVQTRIVLHDAESDSDQTIVLPSARSEPAGHSYSMTSSVP